jgi:hypothetical protein
MYAAPGISGFIRFRVYTPVKLVATHNEAEYSSAYESGFRAVSLGQFVYHACHLRPRRYQSVYHAWCGFRGRVSIASVLQAPLCSFGIESRRNAPEHL